MSITKHLVIQCDVQSCGHKTPMLEFSPDNLSNLSQEEEIRAELFFAFVDHPNTGALYICPKCFTKIFGEG